MSIPQQQDRITKWLLQHQTQGFLKICSIDHVVSVRTDNTEVVAPRPTPDGLVKVTFDDSPVEVPFLIEFESYSSRDNHRQIAESMMSYYLAFDHCPDAILFVLRPSRNSEPNASHTRSAVEYIELPSQRGTSGLRAYWRTIHVWEMQAEDLFALNDPAVVPMIPLTQSNQTPEELLRRCRQVIDTTEPEVRKNLLIVTGLFASFIYTNPRLLNILTENQMIEFPYITKLQDDSLAKGVAQGIDIGRTEAQQAMCQSIMDV